MFRIKAFGIDYCFSTNCNMNLTELFFVPLKKWIKKEPRQTSHIVSHCFPFPLFVSHSKWTIPNMFPSTFPIFGSEVLECEWFGPGRIEREGLIYPNCQLETKLPGRISQILTFCSFCAQLVLTFSRPFREARSPRRWGSRFYNIQPESWSLILII